MGGILFWCCNMIWWCWGQIVHTRLLIDKLHKAVSVLFRCTKIRKSKPAWVRFSQSDVNGNNESSITRCCLVLPSVAEHHCVSTDTLRFSNFLPKSQNQLRLCARCQPPGYETPFGWAVHLKIGGVSANFWYSHYAYNLLMILMYCIIDIQPDDLSEVSSAMLHYINHFVN